MDRTEQRIAGCGTGLKYLQIRAALAAAASRIRPTWLENAHWWLTIPKSARVILSRMLEKYGIDVEMAESAEQAIEYLNSNRPDAIFMDQLMPGMDGLQAVQAIKSNPQTAMIPIMMYTSEEGELYVGQARALGALGVLPKQVRPVDVSKVLYELHLLPERREKAATVLPPMQPDLAARAIDESADLRHFIAASLDSVALRIINDVRATSATPPADTPQMPQLPPAPPHVAVRSTWPWVTSLTLIAAAGIVCAMFWAMSREAAIKARGELAALQVAGADLRRQREELKVANNELTAALAASIANAAPLGNAGAIAARIEAVPYGEIPFDRSRLDVLRDFLAKLEVQGFRGVVKISNAAGLFCLSGNASDGFVPANGNTLIGKCDLLGNPFEESLRGQQRLSLTFANLISGVRQRTAGAITVVLESAGATKAATPYPPRNESVTAAEWNRAAAANNRVEFSAEPNL